MEYILSLINSIVNDPEVAEWIFYLVAAAAGITLAISLSLLFSGIYSPIKLQLQKMGKGDNIPEAHHSFNKSLEHTLEKMPFTQRNFSGDKKTKRLLIHAGFQSENSLKIYNALKLTLVLLGIVIALIVIKLFPDFSPLFSAYMFVFILGIVYLLPGLVSYLPCEFKDAEFTSFFP